MRNLVVARELGRQGSQIPVFLLVYAEGDFPIARKLASHDWQTLADAVHGQAVPMITVSYQELVDSAFDSSRGENRSTLAELAVRVREKVKSSARPR
jgi:hypothetical protein